MERLLPWLQPPSFSETNYDVVGAAVDATKPACAGSGVHSWPDVEGIRTASGSRMPMSLAVAATHRVDHLFNADHRIGGRSHE